MQENPCTIPRICKDPCPMSHGPLHFIPSSAVMLLETTFQHSRQRTPICSNVHYMVNYLAATHAHKVQRHARTSPHIMLTIVLPLTTFERRSTRWMRRRRQPTRSWARHVTRCTRRHHPASSWLGTAWTLLWAVPRCAGLLVGLLVPPLTRSTSTCSVLDSTAQLACARITTRQRRAGFWYAAAAL